MIALPDFFILYNPSRHSQTDPFTGFACISTIQGENQVATLHNVTMQPEQFYSNRQPSGNAGDWIQYGWSMIKTVTGEVQSKRIRDWTNWFSVTKSSDPTLIPVLEICVKPREHFPSMVRRNLHIMVPPIQTNVTTLNNLITSNTISNTIQHIPQIIQHEQPLGTPRRNKMRVGLPTIGLYVAKQLLTLAKQTKEMCPITAEEFMDGHTAVMPCGHLFMHMAIEESFKGRPEECPLCRAPGAPTFV